MVRTTDSTPIIFAKTITFVGLPLRMIYLIGDMKALFGVKNKTRKRAETCMRPMYVRAPTGNFISIMLLRPELPGKAGRFA